MAWMDGSLEKKKLKTWRKTVMRKALRAPPPGFAIADIYRYQSVVLDVLGYVLTDRIDTMTMVMVKGCIIHMGKPGICMYEWMGG
jgi:hypothetical protein